ncbi:MAG: hypothetical protein A3J66_03440 [Candidatus Magasanikbacteria bacterium RIFCSPHIGHO2_02_FULL_47_14]|uniref:Aspartate/ornithine carbamoyltransferase carbamoyl-P binding domain-containing protein n=1 Tax=Candidatus Magasanikbacteria bacterium RIFCSPHIGHO2_02_FULL_47_14 TaxID=1798680 RepID=A0A1F6MAR4_9BACT|nr:MAG: hypothetical protein A3J66_03440 [Candidatus Magasanikbacteria bacterium RIFCSPHIGHO2_02_FULL_47_14]
MPKRDFVHTTDFSKEDYFEIFRRMKIFDDGIKAGRDFSDLLRGKVLASMFLKESTRTMTAFQSGVIRLGGGWTGLTGVQGTYLGTGEEDIGDIVRSIAEVSDVMALRYNDCDPQALAKMIHIPLINAMCGGEEHASGAISLAYPMFKRWGTFEGKKIGMYGMVSSSRPMKAVLSALGTFGVRFLIDPVVDVFRAPDHIEQLTQERGGSIAYAPIDEWIADVDGLIWVEGLPQTGEPQKNVDAFNKAFHQFSLEDTTRIRPDCLFQAVTPRKTTDGRLTMSEDVDNHPQNITWEVLNGFQFNAMALMTYLLGVEVK